MAEYLTNTNDMTKVASAIRAKAGTTEPLVWPDGFKAAIEAISGGGGTGLQYDMGEFVLDADIIRPKDYTINHNLGDTPCFVLVWTDDFAGLNAENTAAQQCNLGYIWFNNLTGMSQRVTSSATGAALTINLNLLVGDYRVAPVLPSSVSYLATVPTDEVFYIHSIGNSYYWRAGVTYKYFVSKAWWNIGGVANAE